MAWTGPENPIAWILYPFTNWMGWGMLILAGLLVRRRIKKWNEKNKNKGNDTGGNRDSNISGHYKL